MNRKELTDYVRSLSPEYDTKEGKQFAEVSLTPESLHSLALRLRDDERTSFDFLDCITGMDYGVELGVIYHLHSSLFQHTIVLRIRINDRIKPQVDTVTDIWEGANLHEREVYDLLGIKFKGHPDLRRLFLDSSWGFPLRKDYADDINIVTK